MNNIEIITYATHAEGNFNELINNKFNIPIKVLGWGKPWKGFIQKLKCIVEYLKKVDDNKLIFIIDGFDVIINKDLKTIYKRFLEFDSTIILSIHNNNNYLSKKVFDYCKYNLIANAGLYCGYNKNLKNLLNFILVKDFSDDDQRNLNDACKYFKNIKLDNKKILFNNLSYLERILDKKYDSCFISTPGGITLSRLKRVPKEYFPYFKNEFIIMFIIIIFLIISFLLN
tara:strand:+ start:338 stop:1021 length:684 start_codon:yes stop_codon:yes gene_type:complete